MAFEPATPANSGPYSISTHAPTNDPHEVLPPPARRKYTLLTQRARDLHAQVPPFADLHDVGTAEADHQAIITRLTRHRSSGGFGLDETAQQVLDERRKLARASAERARLQELTDIRTAKWSNCKQLERNVSDWVTRGGIPGGCTLDVVEDAETKDLLKKGESLPDGVERCRHRLRELAADAHRVRSAPWPSSLAKAAARVRIEQLAEAAEPRFDSMVEHGSPLTFATTSLLATVRGTENPVLAHAETVDVLGTLCWLLKDQLLARINAGIDAVADDKSALSAAQREQALAQIAADELEIERAECSCIWAAEAQGTVLDFRPTTSPLALLGLKLIPAKPNGSGSGTTPGQSWIDTFRPRR